MMKIVRTVCYGFKKHNKAIISLKGRNARTQGKDKKTENDTQIDKINERSRRKNTISRKKVKLEETQSE